ncbi:MAG: hypothetical protein A2504_00430 [Bdellovibrionales bacterium RIFOXYD12_FULL_39_22]|nr:MAG: hypothetical protein A2385_14010 [Bdellovibrionales bacterium RIFOXYB1_FULL_39_21]OFZ42447.1 MAG: hypothetical protein A2485_04060 [Bdellovibrionales bacterium RIFOXYC12_FULL_39_17]OFZ45423.1 MAG: hypothetical protein A2404_01500 [Bdellovibrionales bacterium RIFOXYC1_FULL_39_130]OFZ68417.1 MAG: hypothetical protein A2451_01545 [Bdellovibrionales bacterium RIFOXYC2_FULL_39_8]OFZ74620.1 MAG: hypothetical protein A2560_09530 [Bdellovibrionales bacterium RIFOXYD1_FULL_39_84]OFZ92902.1 MAG:
MKEPNLAVIEKMIYVIRGYRVMLDSDLAELYEVETGQLNRQVRRNASRFPDDFMFELNAEEFEVLKCQIGIAKSGSGGRQTPPLVFTENGVAMLSSVLRSEIAVQVNISIMRIFTKLRSFLLLEKNLTDRMNLLERNTNKMFKIVFERLDEHEEVLPANRKRIGIKINDD